MNAPVSVVIPCYCCAATIHRAVRSVAQQTLLPQEVILVEDASPDDGATRQALQAIRAEYGHLFSVHLILLEQNQGAASARNRGWEAATQPYLAFLDADDAWHPEKIARQFAFLSAHPEIALCGHAHRQLSDPDALPAWPLATAAEPRLLEHRRVLRRNPLVTPSAMLRRDLPFRFAERLRHMEDHLLWMEISLSGHKVAWFADALVATYKPLWGKAGLSSSLWAMGWNDAANYWRLYRKGLLSWPASAFWSGVALLKLVRRLLLYWGWRRWH